MKVRVKLRLIALAAGMALMGLAIAAMTVISQEQAGDLRGQLNQVDSESFHIADQFKEFLRQLNDSLYRLGREPLTKEANDFQKASDALNRWIDDQKPRLSTAREKALMQKIDAAYDDYVLAAKVLESKWQQSSPAQAPRVALGDYAEVMKESTRLFDLGQELAKAHYQSRGVLLGRVNRTIAQMRLLVLVSLCGLFVFGVALAVVVYRDMIAPLRVQLVESQTLAERQEKLASLGLLAAGVAHEIRNPLTAIKAALYIQQKQLAPGSQELADAQVVEREILRLEKIVSDFLSFARPTEPALEVLSTETLLQEVQALLAPSVSGDGVQLVLEPSPALRIRADASQIKQVLINLIRNAADAVARNGVIKLRARPDRRRLASADTPVVILEVEDNGKGIPSEVQQRLFDPFFTTKDAGTGLGLSIAAGIVQKHGGMLQYQTQVDYGTTFGIILPRVTE